MALLCFVKLWAENLVFVYVNEKFYKKKTYFNLFNIVLEIFPIFYTVCIKCIEAEVLNLLNLRCLKRKKNELEV